MHGEARRHGRRNWVADVLGHLYAFGNTEERYRIKILGCKGKGTLGVDRPFQPTLPKLVKGRAGDYDDALASRFGPDREWL